MNRWTIWTNVIGWSGMVYLTTIFPVAMAFAQLDPVTKDVVERSFGINPDNVVQIAFGILICIVIALSLVIVKFFNIITKTEKERDDKMMLVMTNSSNAINDFKEELKNIKDEIRSFGTIITALISQSKIPPLKR